MGLLTQASFGLGALAFCAGAFAESVPKAAPLPTGPKSAAVIDPIDLKGQKVNAAWGDLLRGSLASNANWKVMPRDTMSRKYKEYKLDPAAPCHEFQCAFDVGNVLGVEYVFFGSVTTLDQLYAFTLNLVHVPTSQVVWSRVGEVMKQQSGKPAEALNTSLGRIAAELNPADLDINRRSKRGLLTLLDLSPGGSAFSRAMAERVATHLYASRNYDIMSRRELDELLAALEINKTTFVPSDSGIFRLAGKMDITNLVYSRLIEDQKKYRLQLALYDVSAHKKMREWPSQSSEDFRKLLELEDKFFASLFKSPEFQAGRPAPAWEHKRWAYAGAGLGLALTAGFAYLAYASSQDADSEYRRYQSARSGPEAKTLQSRVQASENGTWLYGILGGVSAAGAGATLVFAF